MLLKNLGSALLLLSLSTNLWADELADLKARNARLETTVQELTLQLAAAIEARKASEAALAAALAAQPASIPNANPTPMPEAAPAVAPAAEELVVEEVAIASEAVAPSTQSAKGAESVRNEACDVQQALAGYKRSGDANKALSEWLQSSNHLQVCSVAELKQIREAVKWDLLGYQKEVLALIDQALEDR